MKYLFSTFQNMGLPQKLHIFFVKDKKKDQKQYQIKLLIQRRNKSLAYPLSCVFSGYLAWFSWPMRWESCVSVLHLGLCHTLHKRAVSLLCIVLKESISFPQAGPKMLQSGDVLRLSPRSRQHALSRTQVGPGGHTSGRCVAPATSWVEQNFCKQAYLLLHSQIS